MSLGQSSITSFFRKNPIPSVTTSTSCQLDDRLESPQPKQSPSSTASVTATPAMDKLRYDQKARKLVLKISEKEQSEEGCMDGTVPTAPNKKTSKRPPVSSKSEDCDSSIQIKRMRGEIQGELVHDTPDRLLESKIPDSSERRSCRRATRLVVSMQEETSESDSESLSLGSDSDTAMKSRAAKTSNAPSMRRTSSRTKREATAEIKNDSSEITILVNEVDHLRYKKPDISLPKSSSQQGKAKSHGRQCVRTSGSDSKKSEESPVLERMRLLKEKSDKEAEAEFWTALSQVDDELEGETKSFNQESKGASPTDIANKDSDQAESTYELERLENIRYNNT
jgi:hypothetical protein